MGICVVRNGEIAETRSWLVRPEDNRYQYWNIKVHGIRPHDTEDAPGFRQVWEEIELTYLDEFDTFVAHNVPFDRSCLQHSAELYRIHLPELKWICSLQMARKIYSFGCNSLDYLCEQLGIEQGMHHRAGDDAEMCAMPRLPASVNTPFCIRTGDAANSFEKWVTTASASAFFNLSSN